MNSVLEIKNDTSYITFEIRGYENKNADNYHDANWLKATLRCSIPPFQEH